MYAVKDFNRQKEARPKDPWAPTVPPAPGKVVPEPSMPKVSWVETSFVTTDAEMKQRYELRLEDEVVVTVLSTAPLAPCSVPPVKQETVTRSQALCEWAQFIDPTKDPSVTLNTLVPFLNGVAVKGAYPLSIEMPPRPNLDPPLDRVVRTRFHYRLTRTPASGDTWRTLLGRPGYSGNHRLVRFTLGTESGYTLVSDFDESNEIATDETQVQLMVVSGWWPIIVFAMLLIFIWFLVAARVGDILRDQPAKPDGTQAAYSLAKSQMAVWIFLVVGSYFMIWMVTRDRSELPGT